jgi:molybdopterin molybdotransferase
MMNVDEARQMILAALTPGTVRTVAIEHALGMVIAEDIVAGMDLPSFDNAAMDGYAVRSEDMRNVPAVLRVVDELPAGSTRLSRLSIGEASAIMTGARIPEGADSVVQVEWTTETAPGEVRINRVVDRGQNIRRRGSEVHTGTTVLSKGTIVRPQEIGLFATLGKRFVQVYSPPRVAVLTTGNELIDLDRPLKDGEIRNSNAYLLAALVRSTGAEAVSLGIVKDNEADLRRSVKEGLAYDILVTSGGVSAGKYDLVKPALRQEGVEILVDKVNIKPGMPFVFGMRGSVPVFSLPGNPVSSMVTFLQFVRPGIRAVMGVSDAGKRVLVSAYLAHEVKKPDGKRHFVRAILDREGDRLIVRTTGPQGSGMITSLTAANCLLILPEDRQEFRSGELMEVELLP